VLISVPMLVSVAQETLVLELTPVLVAKDKEVSAPDLEASATFSVVSVSAAKLEPVDMEA
jgi:hypothetical protein